MSDPKSSDTDLAPEELDKVAGGGGHTAASDGGTHVVDGGGKHVIDGGGGHITN